MKHDAHTFSHLGGTVQVHKIDDETFAVNVWRPGDNGPRQIILPNSDGAAYALAVLQAAGVEPDVNSVEELVATRAGLALANHVFKEGLSAGIRACNASGPDRPFVKPISPYSAPLPAMIKADHQEGNDA